MPALVTEHVVLQTAANATVNEAGARASLYNFALSSVLVAMGFAAQSCPPSSSPTNAGGTATDESPEARQDHETVRRAV